MRATGVAFGLAGLKLGAQALGVRGASGLGSGPMLFF